MKTAYTIPTILLAAFLLSSSARATDTLFTNLNANPASLYDAHLSHTIEGADAGAFLAQGFSFVPSISEQFTQIDIALNVDDGALIVTLNSDSSGLPGSLLETWTVTGLPTGGDCCVMQTLVSNLAIDLFTGAHYWIVAMPGADDKNGGWSLNNIGVKGPRAAETDAAGPFSINESNLPIGAFDVIGNGVQVTPPVPEPASFGLLGVGLALLGGFRGRRGESKEAAETRLLPAPSRSRLQARCVEVTRA